jgi:hypothetical protein
MKLRRNIYIKVFRGHFLTRIVGADNDSRSECEGLSHPRTLAGDWREIESTFKKIIISHGSTYNRIIKPTLLVHLIPKFEGGYTSSELRLFQQVGVSAGANFCLICEDKYGPLTNEQLTSVFKLW